MVREERLELSRVTPLEPKSSASTNSATLAKTSIEQVLNLTLCTRRLFTQKHIKNLLNPVLRHTGSIAFYTGPIHEKFKYRPELAINPCFSRKNKAR